LEINIKNGFQKPNVSPEKTEKNRFYRKWRPPNPIFISRERKGGQCRDAVFCDRKFLKKEIAVRSVIGKRIA